MKKTLSLIQVICTVIQINSNIGQLFVERNAINENYISKREESAIWSLEKATTFPIDSFLNNYDIPKIYFP